MHQEKSAQRRVAVARRAFRTPEGEARFGAAYAATLARWPVAYERFDVPTRFGPTHVIAAGPEHAPPLILLHAFCMGASSWYANVGEWSRYYRVYALDVMSDVNLSVMEQVIRRRDQFADWLGDAMDALGVASAPLVGHSYGGWVSLNMALCRPERVQRVALLAPAASFAPLNLAFTLRQLSMLVFPRWAVDSFIRWCVKPGNELPLEVARQFYEGVVNYKWQYVVRPNLYTDEELRQIQTPVLVLYGDHEVILDAAKALRRAQSLLPNAQTETIPGASHMLISEQPAAVNERVLQFLQA